jgi:hypothetical protein
MKLAVSRIHISPGLFSLVPLIANTIDIEGRGLLMGFRFQMRDKTF